MLQMHLKEAWPKMKPIIVIVSTIPQKSILPLGQSDVDG